jgi:hypothetical protein
MDFNRESIQSDRLQNYDANKNEIQRSTATYQVESALRYQQEAQRIDAEMDAKQAELSALALKTGNSDALAEKQQELNELRAKQNKLNSSRAAEEARLSSITEQQMLKNVEATPTGTSDAAKGSASIGTLAGGFKTVLKEIRLFHVHNNGTKMNAYHIHNPKILQVTMDELNMEDSSGNYLTLSIGYDAFDVDTSIPLHGEPNAALPQSSDNTGLNYVLHDSTYAGAVSEIYHQGNVEFSNRAAAYEAFENETQPEFSVTDPSGQSLYSNDGENWQYADGQQLLAGDVVDGKTFNPPTVDGTDDYGFPTSDGSLVEFGNMFSD